MRFAFRRVNLSLGSSASALFVNRVGALGEVGETAQSQHRGVWS